MVNKDRKIKQLDIVFENCESCTLMPDMIYMCALDKIYKNIGINLTRWFDEFTSLLIYLVEVNE